MKRSYFILAGFALFLVLFTWLASSQLPHGNAGGKPIFQDVLKQFTQQTPLGQEDVITFIKHAPPTQLATQVPRVTITEPGYALSVARHSNTNAPVTFATSHGTISFASFRNPTLGPVNAVSVRQSGNQTIYDNIYTGVSLIYTASSDSLLEEYELKTKRPLTAIIQQIDTTAVTSHLQPDGAMLFTNAQTGQFAFAIPRPVMYEAANPTQRSYGLHYELTTINNETYLIKVIDPQGQQWLHQQANYPVMVDATVSLTLFSFASYPILNNTWQVRLDTVGQGDLGIQLAAGTTPQDLQFQSFTCGDKEIAVPQNGIVPNFSCADAAIITNNLLTPGQHSFSVSYSGLTTTITSPSQTGTPVILSGSVNPPVVKVGDTLTVTAHVTGGNGITTVTADMGGIDTIPLTNTAGTLKDGIWTGTWIVHATTDKPYQVTISATDTTGATAQNAIAFFDPSSWYGPAWFYRKKITIDHTKVPADQTNFPVLIVLTSDTNVAAHAQSSGNDMVFTASDGVTKLNHEIEKYVSGTGELEAWVQVPTLSSSADTILYLYYGNASASNQQNPTGVWDSNFKGVWHSGDTSGTTVVDSTGNVNGTKASAGHPNPTTSGEIDGAQTYTRSSSDYVDVSGEASLVASGNVTFSFWFTPTSTYTGGSYQGLMSLSSSGSHNDIRVFLETAATSSCSAGNIGVEMFNNSGTENDTCSLETSWTGGTWYAISVTYNTTTGVALYVNGSLDNSINFTGRGTTPTATSFFLGKDWAAGGNFNGKLDELRVSNTTRSANWIKTEYNNESSPSTFFTLGSEEKPLILVDVKGGVKLKGGTKLKSN